MMKMKNGNQYKTQKRQDDGWGGVGGGGREGIMPIKTI